MSPEQPHPASEELFAYRDGELAAERRTVIEAHVSGCRICRERIDEVSGLEADLRARPDDVDERYYQRLEDAVLQRVAGEDRAPRYERRKPDADGALEERRGAPRLPWAGIFSTASAAAAVLVVVVVLVRQGAVWRAAPRPVLLEKSAPDAGLRTRADSAAAPASSPDRKNAPAPAALPARERLAQLESQPITGGKDHAKLDALKEGEPKQERDELEVGSVEAPAEKLAANRVAPSDASSRAMGIAAAPKAQVSAPDAGSGGYAPLVARYGLPPTWEEGSVSNESLRRAEPELRYLYRTGGAGGDSARVRLYIAEAVRLRAGAAPDSAAYDEIVHHYRRAIRLAGDDAETARVAAQRLEQFLQQVTPR